jgi:hypothetical protein
MKISEHDMLVTLASMALKMDDLTGHDITEALRELGHGNVIAEARQLDGPSKKELLQIARR